MQLPPTLCIPQKKETESDQKELLARAVAAQEGVLKALQEKNDVTNRLVALLERFVESRQQS